MSSTYFIFIMKDLSKKFNEFYKNNPASIDWIVSEGMKYVDYLRLLVILLIYTRQFLGCSNEKNKLLLSMFDIYFM